MRKWLVISGILLLMGCVNVPDHEYSQRQEEIQNTIDSLVIQNEIPGLNFSIIYDDGIQENYSSGFADMKKRIELNPDHVLFSGSIGKTYAVAVLMQLADEGKLNLSDRFIDHFPEIEWLKELPNISDITIEMLLSHTSGLPRYVMKEGVWDTIRTNPDKIWTYYDRLSFICGKPAIHPAGEGWGYSDSNYILLGMLIEKITGSNYYDVVMSRILIPEALKATHPAIRRDIPDLPVGYSRLPESFGIPDEVVFDGIFIFNPQMEWTGGGFASTTPDLARWAKKYYHGAVIPDALLARMVTANPNGIDIDPGLSYGMGSFIYETSVGTAYGHTGFMPGFNSIFAWFPEQKIAIALQSNCDYASSEMSLIDYVDRIVAGIISD